jgi:hypothetical protein
MLTRIAIDRVRSEELSGNLSALNTEETLVMAFLKRRRDARLKSS